jgi:DHA2 family multidrug resistance protein
LTISSLAIYHMTSFDLTVGFRTLVWARIFQASGLAFLFIPINTAAYSGLASNKSNDASALMNLARNMGGSVGISVVTTVLARRAQFHQSRLASHVTPFNPITQRWMHGMSAPFTAHGGSSPAFAMQQAQRTLYEMVQRQAQMLSYIDVFWLLAVGCACMIPLLFLMKKNKPGGGGPAGH